MIVQNWQAEMIYQGWMAGIRMKHIEAETGLCQKSVLSVLKTLQSAGSIAPRRGGYMGNTAS